MVFVSWASDGLRIHDVDDNKEIIQLEHKPSTTLKCLSIAKLSMYMGYLDQTKVVLLNMNDSSVVSTILVESASRIQLSPCGMFGFVYTPFKIDDENPSGSPNIFVYDMINRIKLKEYIFRRGDGWQPQWNLDSSFCSIFVNGEIHMYANNQFCKFAF
ncbi:Eukaryotic translation initiation factor 2A [Schistosoma japonicum]|nr:Eukaryotic translation initiation factor 2A [Schistosoma japonicum]